MDLPHLLEQSRAGRTRCYERDRDYIVAALARHGRDEPSVVIVDREHRVRRWAASGTTACTRRSSARSRRAHQAGRRRRSPPITIQNFFKMYRRLAGMTGTADTEAQEFHDIYKLDVVAIPTNRPVVRRDFDDMVFLNAKDKWKRDHRRDQELPRLRPADPGGHHQRREERVPRGLLAADAPDPPRGAQRQAARAPRVTSSTAPAHLGSVMIATNMAGRGTDIKLGAVTRQALLDHWQRRGICPASVTVDSTDEQLREGVYRKIAARELGKDRKAVDAMPFAELELRVAASLGGGAHVAHRQGHRGDEGRCPPRSRSTITGRFLLHRIRWFASIEDIGRPARRGHRASPRPGAIDNQLRGRAGRQGDKGSSAVLRQSRGRPHEDVRRRDHACGCSSALA
jgi:preprotein translocase subunit SecA